MKPLFKFILFFSLSALSALYSSEDYEYTYTESDISHLDSQRLKEELHYLERAELVTNKELEVTNPPVLSDEVIDTVVQKEAAPVRKEIAPVRVRSR